MASPYDHRMELLKYVNNMRRAAGKPLLYSDEIAPGANNFRHNLQRAAQYRVWRLQSGEGDGWIPADVRTDLNKARAAFYTGQDAKCLSAGGVYDPWELAKSWEDGRERDVIIDDRWNEIGVGVGGGPLGLIFVVFLGHRDASPVPEGLVGPELRIALPEDMEIYEADAGLSEQFPW